MLVSCLIASLSLSLIHTEENGKIVTEEQGIHDIARAMKLHSNSSSLMEAACAALWSLCSAGEEEIIRRKTKKKKKKKKKMKKKKKKKK